MARGRRGGRGGVRGTAAVTVRGGTYYRERGSQGGGPVPELPPTPDPAVPDSMLCIADERYYRGGLVKGGIKTTGNPSDTP